MSLSNKTPEQLKMDFVVNRLAQERAAFYRRKNYNRKVTWFFAAGAALLSATATVSLGLSDKLGIPGLESLALVATGLATVVGVTEALFSHRKLWHINNVALASLDKLDRDLGFRLSDQTPVTKAEVDEFYGRLDKTLSDIDQAWVETYAVK